MNERNRLFVDEYLVDFNGTRAYKAVYGANDASAAKSACRLLQKKEIKQYLDMRIRERRLRMQITQDMVVEELKNVAFANITDYAQVLCEGGKNAVVLLPTEELSAQQKSAIATIKSTSYGVEIKLHDKLRSLELLSKHLGFPQDRGEAAASEGEMQVYFDVPRPKDAKSND